MTQICLTLLIVSVGYGQGRIRGLGLRNMHPPTTIFRNVSDEHNSFIILNLFDNNKPYALNTRNRKCAEQNALYFGEALRKGQKL